MYLDAHNLYGWTMFQKLSVNELKTSKFDEKFINNYDEESDKRYIDILKDFAIFTVIYHFYQKEWRSKNFISLFVIFIIKATMMHI